MDTRTSFILSITLSALLTAGAVIATFAPLSSRSIAAGATDTPPTAALQRLPTVFVTPDLQVLPEVVVVADPADVGEDDRFAADLLPSQPAASAAVMRRAAFDMPYYSFAKASTSRAKE